MGSGAILIELCDSHCSVVTSISKSLQDMVLGANLPLYLVAIEVAIRPFHQLELVVLLVLAQEVSHLFVINFNYAHADVVFNSALVVLDVPIKLVY